MNTPNYRPNLVKRRIRPEDDTRGLDPAFMSDTSQKAYFLAAAWLVGAIHASFLLVHFIRQGEVPSAIIFAIIAMILWRRVAWNVKTAMLYR